MGFRAIRDFDMLNVSWILSCLKIFSFSMIFCVFSSATVGQVRQPENLTGNWFATTYYKVGSASGSTEKSCISIEMVADNVVVETSHGSSWKGTFSRKTRVLAANYQRGKVSGRVILWLSDDGDTLEGEWFNHVGESGKYVAVRHCNESTKTSRIMGQIRRKT